MQTELINKITNDQKDQALVTDLQIIRSNVTDSHFYAECNTERGFIDQLYIELGLAVFWYKLLTIPIICSRKEIKPQRSIKCYPVFLFISEDYVEIYGVAYQEFSNFC